MLSRTADYALRALLFLGRTEADGAPKRAEEIADATGAPHNYMAKVLNAAAKGGFVESARGPAGGFILAREPSDITLAAIIDRFDEPQPISHCLLGTGACNHKHPCAAHHAWTRILDARRAPLESTTLADLLSSPTK